MLERALLNYKGIASHMLLKKGGRFAQTRLLGSESLASNQGIGRNGKLNDFAVVLLLSNE